MDPNQEKMSQLYLKVQKMAATDEKFRKEILTNPIETLEKLTGEKFPEGASIKIIEQDPSYSTTIVLPKFVGDALEAEDLDNVAGGLGGVFVVWF